MYQNLIDATYQNHIKAIDRGITKIQQNRLQGIEELVSALGNTIEYLINEKYSHELYLGKLSNQTPTRNNHTLDQVELDSSDLHISYVLRGGQILARNSHEDTPIELGDLVEVYFHGYPLDELLTVAEGLKEALQLQADYDKGKP